MGDCISREELLRAVSEAADVELVRRWIPVGKRLPKDCGEYLVRANSERFPGVKYTGICLYCNDNKTWYSDHSRVEGITHWMPLPEPPEEKHERQDG